MVLVCFSFLKFWYLFADAEIRVPVFTGVYRSRGTNKVLI